MKEHFCPAEQSIITYQGECSWCGEIEGGVIEVIKDILTGIDQTGIESSDGWWETSTGAKLGAEALKQILELLAQTQEPVAMWDGKYQIEFGNLSAYKHGEHSWIPLYTSPQRTWVGLTDEEVSEVFGGDIHAEHSGELRFVRAIEAKLKELNT